MQCDFYEGTANVNHFPAGEYFALPVLICSSRNGQKKGPS